LAVSGAGSWDAMLCEWQSWFPATTRFNGASPFLFDSHDIYETYASAFKDVTVDTFQQKITKDLFFKRMLSDYLRKSDMMSMMNSLEYRVPMLDEDLVDFSLNIPYAQKSTRSIGKVMFRKLHATIYPSYTSSLSKSGFSIPLDKWLTIEDAKEMQQLIGRSDGIVGNFIDKKYVDFLFKALSDSSSRKVISRAAVYQRVLILYSLQYWFFNNYKNQ
jgi:asparagine synthase (glutamine-hydrolysing)